MDDELKYLLCSTPTCNLKNTVQFYLNSENMTDMKRRKLFNDILVAICENDIDSQDSEEMLKPFCPDEDIDYAIIFLAGEFGKLELLKCIIKRFNGISDILTLIIKAVKLNMINFHILANNLLNAYDYKLTEEEIEFLEEGIKDLEKQYDRVYDKERKWLSFKRALIDKFSEVPKWVSVQEGENIGLADDLKTGPSSEGTSDEGPEGVNIGDVLTQYNKFKNIDLGDSYTKNKDSLEQFKEKAKNLIKETILTHEPEQEIEGMEDFKEEEEYNPDELIESYINSLNISDNTDKEYLRCRLYGPSNRMSDRDCSITINEQGVGGPCRMLICVCSENNFEDEEENDNEWFTGRCDSDSCRRKIRDMSHSVRFPVKGGGWKGCYCSIHCMESDPPYEIGRAEKIALMNLKKCLKEVGVMNRIVI